MLDCKWGPNFVRLRPSEAVFLRKTSVQSSKIGAAPFAPASRISYAALDFAERLASAGFYFGEMICRIPCRHFAP
jgi:hypothetical protein